MSAEWLKANIERPDVVVLDCSWYLPAMERDPRAEHEAKRVPGARFFDVDRVSDPSSPLPHMLPDAGAFAAACDAVGVANGDQVVVYDGTGLFSAARGWCRRSAARSSSTSSRGSRASTRRRSRRCATRSRRGRASSSCPATRADPLLLCGASGVVK